VGERAVAPSGASARRARNTEPVRSSDARWSHPFNFRNRSRAGQGGGIGSSASLIGVLTGNGNGDGNGVDTARFTPAREDPDPRRLIVLLGGSQYRRYRLEVGLRVFAAVRRRRPAAHLLITGQLVWQPDQAENRRIADALVAELGLAGHVSILGPYPQDSAPAVFQRARRAGARRSGRWHRRPGGGRFRRAPPARPRGARPRRARGRGEAQRARRGRARPRRGALRSCAVDPPLHRDHRAPRLLTAPAAPTLSRAPVL
jgi:hypothetical protein